MGANHHYFAVFIFSSSLCLISACAIPVLPLSPGTLHVANSTYGIVFGRIEILREGFDQMAYSFGKEFGWWMTEENTGRRYVIRTLTRDGAFAVNFPAGRYRITGVIYDEGAGVWEGRVPATLVVHAGHATYIGTWEIGFSFAGRAGSVSARVRNEMDKATAELLRAYTGKPRPLLVALLKSAPEGYFSLIELRIGQ